MRTLTAGRREGDSQASTVRGQHTEGGGECVFVSMLVFELV